MKFWHHTNRPPEIMEIRDLKELGAHMSERLKSYGIVVNEKDLQIDRASGLVLMRNVDGYNGRRYFGSNEPSDYFGVIGHTEPE